MLYSRKFSDYLLFALAAAFVFYSGDACADDILQTIRNRAANILRNLKPVIFVLGGFGIIGFAFAAIFGKISWKWFSHIAIGLFLVANMGLFVDYFISRTGKDNHVKEALGYGVYLDADYSGTSGTGGGEAGAGNNGDNLNNCEGDDCVTENTGDICTPACEAGKTCTNGTCVSSGGSGSGGDNNAGGSGSSGDNGTPTPQNPSGA